MKGIIFNAVESAVGKLVSPDAWDDLIEAADVDGSYTAIGNYSDDDLAAIVAAASEATGLPPDEVLRLVGREAFNYFVSRYPELVEGLTGVIELLGALNDIIHPEVLKIYPDARPPSFELTSLGDDKVRVVYASTRRLSALAEGLLHGGADSFGETITISPVSNDGNTTTFDLSVNAMAAADG